MEERNLENQGVTPNPQPLNPIPTTAQEVQVSPLPVQNSQTAVLGVAGPNKGGKGKTVIWIILGLVLLLALAAIAYFLGSGKVAEFVKPKTESGVGSTPVNEEFVEETTVSNEANVEGTESWLTFKKEGQFSFKYPLEGEIKEYPEEDSVAVTQNGPTQKEGTEFYDGLSMSFRAFDPQGKTLKEVADEKYLQLKEVFETTQPVVAQVAGQSGYSFHVKGYVEGDYYYVAINETLFLEIINATKDPTNAGFNEISEKILMTVVLGP